MLQEKVTVKNTTGIHSRPAAVLVKLSRKYQSQINLIHQDKIIKLNGLMALLRAGIKGGCEVGITCDGPDEQAAMDELRGLFNNGFGEV